MDWKHGPTTVQSRDTFDLRADAKSDRDPTRGMVYARKSDARGTRINLVQTEKSGTHMHRGWNTQDVKHWTETKADPARFIEMALHDFDTLDPGGRQKSDPWIMRERLILTFTALHLLLEGFRVDPEVEVLRVLAPMVDHFMLDGCYEILDVLVARSVPAEAWMRFCVNPTAATTAEAIVLLTIEWSKLSTELYGSEDSETVVPSGSADGDGIKMPTRIARAGASWEWVCAKHPSESSDAPEGLPYTIAQHRIISSEGCNAYSEESPVPDFHTWARYVREYIRLKTGRSRTARPGRPDGKSVIRKEDA